MRTLTERRYSTQTLRDQSDRGPSAYYGSASDPFDDPDRTWDAAHSWARSLRDNFDFYRTGELEILLKPGEPPIQLSGLIPPDGPWMTEAAARQAHEYLNRRGRSARPTPNRWSWSGFPVLVDGEPGTLRPPHDAAAADVRWRVVLDSGVGRFTSFRRCRIDTS